MERLEEDTLYLAATRPALFMGIPLPVSGVFLMLAGFTIVIMKNPLYELTMLPLWFGTRIMVARDYNMVNVAALFLRTAGRSIDGSAWGGASVSPNPIRPGKRPRGMLA